MEKSSVVIYKNVPALIGERDGDKFSIDWCSYWGRPKGKKNNYASQKVRGKDVVPLCERPASAVDSLMAFAASCADET